MRHINHVLSSRQATVQDQRIAHQLILFTLGEHMCAELQRTHEAPSAAIAGRKRKVLPLGMVDGRPWIHRRVSWEHSPAGNVAVHSWQQQQHQAEGFRGLTLTLETQTLNSSMHHDAAMNVHFVCRVKAQVQSCSVFRPTSSAWSCKCSNRS